MDINRDQVVAMFSRFEASALASFVAASRDAIGDQSVDSDLLELVNMALLEGQNSVGAVDFEVMVKEPIRRHGLTGHELSVLFTVDRIAHAADLLVEPNVIDYIVTLHDTGINDDEVTRVSIHKLRATTDHAAWIEAHRLAEHFMNRLHTVSRVVEPITVRGARVVGDAVDLGEFAATSVVGDPDELVLVGADGRIDLTKSSVLTASAILAWLDDHEPGPEIETVHEGKPGEYLGLFTRPGKRDVWLYSQFEASTSVNAFRIALALAGRHGLKAIHVKHFESGDVTRIAKYPKQDSET